MNGFEVQVEDDAIEDRMTEVKTTSKTPKSNRKAKREKICYVNDGTRIRLLNETSLYAVFVSYIEIYNNTVYDLLDEASGKTLQIKILREDSRRSLYVNRVVEIEVTSREEAFEIFNAGQKRNRMGCTVLNAQSSHSHSIFNIRVVQLELTTWIDGKPTVSERNLITVGQFSLVDLVGSERTHHTQNTGMRLKEAGSINKSLIVRENQCIKSNKIVPCRGSRLTYLFKSYFEGEGSMQMIVCVNCSIDDFEENLHVLKFAEMSQNVKITKSVSKTNTGTVKKTNAGIETPPKITSSGFTTGKFDIENVEEDGPYINKILKAFKQRKSKSITFNKKIKESTDDFRKRLLEHNQESMLNKTELCSLK